MEDHLWSDTEQGGDIWNGRWKNDTIEHLLPNMPDQKVPLSEYKLAVKWIQRLTFILQRAQRALYSARHVELQYKELQARRDRFF